MNFHPWVQVLIASMMRQVSAGGAHRMMLAKYNFTDPGVYAEDDNAYWDIKQRIPRFGWQTEEGEGYRDFLGVSGSK